MILNQTQGVVAKYASLLKNCGVISDNDNVLIDPQDEDFKKNNIIVLQQGNPLWNIDKNKDKIKRVIVLSPLVFDIFLKKEIKTSLLEFPIPDVYRKITPWQNRQDAIYFHGRIVPGKLPIEDLEKLDQSGIKVYLRGPICKKYWTSDDINEKDFVEYKEKLKTLKNIIFLPETQDKFELINSLNKFKFYFTLSTGEAFNVALQEAIACGTIPLVRKNGAYWWAEKLKIDFSSVEELISLFERYKKSDIENYSDSISQQIKTRCSYSSMADKNMAGFWNGGSQEVSEIDFEIKELVRNYNNYVQVFQSCSGHYNCLKSYISWKGKTLDFNKIVTEKFPNLKFRWRIEELLNNTVDSITKLSIQFGENFFLDGKKYNYKDKTIKREDLLFDLLHDFNKLMV